MEFKNLRDININLDKLKELDLTVTEYVWLYCSFHGIEFNDSIDLGKLERKHFIKLLDDDKLDYREKTKKLFEPPDNEKAWGEFFTTFPLKVPGRNGASRPLRASTLDSKSAVGTRAKYLKIIKGKPELHIKIMKILDAELEMRRNSNSLAYMHNIDTWLNQRDDEKYAYLIEDEKKKNGGQQGKQGYGERLI